MSRAKGPQSAALPGFWTKPKRKRASGLPKSEIPSCDTCRLRRVKCVRSSLAEACEACTRTHINCTSRRAEWRGHKPADTTPAAQRAEPSSSSRSTASSSLSHDSADGRLLVLHESESAMATFLDQYLRHSTFDVPLVRWRRLQARFERAGYRLSQLDVTSETIVLACIAFGALSSDLPRLVGQDSPKITEVASATTKDLSVFAHRRRPVCIELVDKVMRQVDVRGAFKAASMESVMLLGLASDLRTHQDGMYAWDECRPYWAAQLSHLLHMAEESRPTGHELQGAVEFFLCIKDAFRSAYTGNRLIVPDEAMLTFLGRWDRPRFSPVEEHIALTSADHDVYASLPAARWIEIIRLARNLATWIAIPMERSQLPELETFETFLATASELSESIEATRANIGRIFPTLSPDVLESQKAVRMDLMDGQLASAPSALLVLFVAFLKRLVSLRKAYNDHPTLKTGPSDDERLAQLEAQLTVQLTLGVLRLTAMLESPGQYPGLFLHLSPFPFVRFALHFIAQIALRTPCAELGGPPFFPRAAQTRAVEILIRALRVQSFVWARKADEADTTRQLLDRLLVGKPVGRAPSASATTAHGQAASVSDGPPVPPAGALPVGVPVANPPPQLLDPRVVGGTDMSTSAASEQIAANRAVSPPDAQAALYASLGLPYPHPAA